MAEEHRFEAQEGHILCANNCGFFGSPTTQNFCSKCYHEVYLRADQKKKIDPLFPQQLSIPSTSTAAAASVLVLPEPAEAEVKVVTPAGLGEPIRPAAHQPNRCSVCRKKVGLTGFKCRCGITYCGTHRYPEIHGCSFDFKYMGREAIAKANPLVKAEKLDRI